MQRPDLLFGMSLALASWGTAALAAPVGGSVAAGKASISQSNGQTMIQQSSAKAILDWKQFNIGAKESVKFVQPNSNAVALNRIQSGSPSRIDGQLLANGQVFLVNPQGILFGSNASVNVGGLVASTLNLDATDFMAGRYNWKGNGTGSIQNEGQIQAEGGYVGLLGAQISNSGQIMANKGSVVLATGQELTLDISGNGMVNVVIPKGVAQALVHNSGLIQADGGQVLLTTHAAQAAVNSVVNNTGIIRAQTLGERNGKIVLLADMSEGTARIGGTLDASAPNGGNGGFIETSGAKVRIDPQARITTLAPQGQTGKWLVDPQDYTVAASGGDQTGQQLSASLETTNVELQSGSGLKAGNGDIHINDTVNWKANTTLTLTASNDVNVNANITSQGDNAGLVIQANTAHGKEAATGKGVFNLNNAEISLLGQSPQLTFANNDININNGKIHLTGQSPKLKIAGEDYVVITKLGDEGSLTGKDLQGINGNLTVNYALGADIDAKATENWNVTGGFKPIGKVTTAMMGNNDCQYLCALSDTNSVFNQKFQGLGHSINQLFFKNSEVTTPVGLFQALGTNAVVGNLTIKDFSMKLQAYLYVNNSSYVYSSTGVGALAGFNAGSVANARATGVIEFNAATNTSSNCALISTCYTYTGDLTVGGMAGYSSGNIEKSSTQVQISFIDTFTSLTPYHQVNIGGLVGLSNSSIQQSHASGEVSFLANGDNQSRIVSTSIGGLVGETNALGGIATSYSTGNVKFNCENCSTSNQYPAVHYIGGLVGAAFYGWQGITRSYSSSNVTSVSPSSKTTTGGLVGYAYNATFNDTYASGMVSGPGAVGGLIGVVSGSTVSKSFFSGDASSSAPNASGALIGNCVGSCTVSSSFFSNLSTNSTLAAVGGFRRSWTDVATSSDTNSISNVTAIQLNASDFKKQTNFTSATSANGQVNPAWDFNKTWFMYEGQTGPMLQALMTPLTITANSVVKTYDGNNYQTNAGVSYSQTPDSRLLGNLNLDGTALGAKNVGTYGIKPSGQYSNQLGYLIHYVDGNLNITPANLSASGLQANHKIYDGNAVANINTSQSALNGVISGDVVGLSTSAISGFFADSNVGNGKSVSIKGLSIYGADAANYNLLPLTSTANITPYIKSISVQETYLNVTQEAPSTWRNESEPTTEARTAVYRAKKPIATADSSGLYRSGGLIQWVGDGIRTAND